MRRDALAWTLWGDSGRRNLRQLLYQVRQLPGAQDWLHVDEVSVTVNLPCDGRMLLRGEFTAVHALSVPLEGLDDVGTDAFADWVRDTRERLVAARHTTLLARAEQLVVEQPGDALKLVGDIIAAPHPPLDVVWVAVLAHQALGQTDIARALADRAAPQVSTLAVDERSKWASLRPGTRIPVGAHQAPLASRLKVLLTLEPSALPPTVAAAVLGVEPMDIVGVWPSVELDEPPEDDLGMAALRVRLAEVLEEQGHLDRAAHHFLALGQTKRAAELWWTVGLQADDLEALERCAQAATDTDSSLALRAWCFAVIGWRVRRDIARSQQVHDNMLRAANRTQHPTLLAHARMQQVSLATLQRVPEKASYARERLAELAEHNPSFASLEHAIDGMLAAMQRDLPRSIELLTRACAGGDIERLQALQALGAAHGMSGDSKRARAAHTEGLALSRNLGVRAISTAFLVGLAATAEKQGDLVTAREHLIELRDLKNAGVQGPAMHTAVFNLAIVDLRLGRLADARRLLAEVLQQQPDDATRALVYGLRGDVEATVGRFAEAAAWAARGQALFSQIQRQSDAQVMAFNALVATWYGDPSAAVLRAVRVACQDVLQSGRPICSAVARDMALIERDVDAIDALRMHWVNAHPAHVVLVELRRDILDGVSSVDDAVVLQVRNAPSTAALWGRALLASQRPDLACTLQDETGEHLRTLSEGLLTAQREALAARVDAWWADPIQCAGPL